MNLARIESVQAVVPHPNADRLDIALVAGYECIVVRDSYKVGDICIFIQPDSVLPPAPREDGWPDQDVGTFHPWVVPYLKYVSSSRRVKAAKLRGVWSMGLVVPVNQLAKSLVSVGDDVTEQLGITKYEAPLPKDVRAKGGLPFSMPKTDEDRWQGLYRVLPSYLGHPVDVTLKIDGTSYTAYCKLTDEGPVTGVCGRNIELKIEETESTNYFLEITRKYGILAKLEEYCVSNRVSLALRGELYGSGIQKGGHNPHSTLPLGIKFYSCLDLSNLKYYPPGSDYYFENVAQELELPSIDVLERCVPLTMDLIHKYDSGVETVDGRPFEGVVIKGAFGSFKVINKAYDSKK